MRSLFNKFISVPHRSFHESSANIMSFRQLENCRFGLIKTSFGLTQPKLSYDYEHLYRSNVWITPAPQSSGIYQDTALPRIEKLVETIDSFGKKDLKILEIGGGNTFIAEQISDRFKNVHITCLDPSYSTKTINESIKLISGFFPTDLQNQKFDLIFSFNTLEHIPDSASFLKALNEFLVESGLLVISFPESSKQIANGDWNLFSQQHVNYFIAPFFFDYFEKYDLKIVDYVVQYDEAIVTCRKPSKEQKTSQLFGGFDSISSSAEIDLRFLNKFNAISDLLLSNKANLDRFFVHGATAGILNIVSNLRNAEFFWDNLKIIDNDSIKHGKYLSGFRNQVFPLDQVSSQPLSVLIATSTFSNEIKKSWLDRFNGEKIKFYLV